MAGGIIVLYIGAIIAFVISGGVLLGKGCSPDYPAICNADVLLDNQHLTGINATNTPCVPGSTVMCKNYIYDFETCVYTSNNPWNGVVGYAYDLYVDKTQHTSCTPASERPDLSKNTKIGIGLLAVAAFMFVLGLLVCWLVVFTLLECCRQSNGGGISRREQCCWCIECCIG